MAIVNLETDGFDNKPSNALFSTGKTLKSIVAKVEVGSADSGTSNYIMARGLSLSDIIVGIRLPKGVPGFTSGNDYDIGLGYLDKDGDIVAVEVDVFADGEDFSSALAYCLDVCGSSTTDTIGEALTTEVSTEEAKSNYIIYLTANATVSSGGNLDFVIDIATSA